MVTTVVQGQNHLLLGNLCCNTLYEGKRKKFGGGGARKSSHRARSLPFPFLEPLIEIMLVVGSNSGGGTAVLADAGIAERHRRSGRNQRPTSIHPSGRLAVFNFHRRMDGRVALLKK